MTSVTPLPPEVQCDTSFGGGAVYIFPRRDLGGFRWVGLAPIAGGCVALAFLAFWVWGFAGGMVQMFGPWGALSGLLILPGVAAAVGGVLLGGAISFGHAEIHVANGVIRYGERIGPTFWRKSVRRERIARLAVHSIPRNEQRSQAGLARRVAEMAALKAEVHQGKPRWLAIGYPEPWLKAVADHLAAEDALDVAAVAAPPLPVVLVESPVRFGAGDIDRFEKPAGSLVEHREIPGGFTLVVPALGVWRGSAGLFLFSLFWCGFMTLFTGGVGLALLNDKKPDGGDDWIFALFIAVFWAVGVGMLLGAINMGRRQAAIAVAGGQLKLIQLGLFGTKRREWLLEELATARKGKSGMEVNDVPVMQLHIVPRDGKPYGLLTGRDEEELEWIATLLRQAIPPQQGAGEQ